MSPDAIDPQDDIKRLRRSFFAATSFAAILWLLKLVEMVLGLDFARFGVYPMQVGGLKGIFLAPLIHGSLSHLFSNTAPIMILGTALLYGYPRSAKIVFPIVYLGSGLGVWLFARSAFHIGASGLTFGVMFFVFTIGALRRDKRAMVLSMLVFFLYGSMIWGVFPGDPDTSFETHFFGAIIGVALAIVLKNHDPPPPQKKYSWEEEADELQPEDDETWQTSVSGLCSPAARCP
jgi:membrane associated rhomboid family serine protease